MKPLSDIVDQTGILLIKDAIAAGVPKHVLYSCLKDNEYERVAHGIFASPEAWEDKNYIISLRCPQAVFSHDEALYYHGLIDREPMRQTITIYTGYGTSRLLADGIKVFTVKKELLDIGKVLVKSSYGHMIPMYDLERTICDLVRSRRYFEIQDFQTALKAYVGRKGNDLNKLIEYAKLFHIENKLREYMEVLL